VKSQHESQFAEVTPTRLPTSGIDRLAAIVQQEFHLDPFSNALFLFCGRRADRIKALYWEGDGFVLLYK